MRRRNARSAASAAPASTAPAASARAARLRSSSKRSGLGLLVVGQRPYGHDAVDGRSIAPELGHVGQVGKWASI